MTEITTENSVKRSFGGPEAARLADISYRQLDHWARKDLVTPSVAPAQGSGSQRRYSYEDIVELKVIKKMRDADISLQRIDKVFAYIRDELNERASEVRIIIDSNRVYACHSNDEVIDLINQGQGVFALALGNILEEIEGAVSEFKIETGGNEAMNTLPLLDDAADTAVHGG